MRHWPWLALAVVVLAGLGWRFGTPYVNDGPTVCFASDGCRQPVSCGYLGLQGRIILDGKDSCPFVKLLKWDHTRSLFNLAAARPSPQLPRQPRPPLPAGRAYCNGPSGPINPGDKPDQPNCVDP